MAGPRPVLPQGHGELVVRPPYAEWAALADSNARAASGWDFEIAGVPADALRMQARREAAEAASAFSARLGVRVREAPAEPARIVMTGHQPQLYHPGVWVKDFLLQRIADETGALPLDLVVDSDGFDSVAAEMPCMRPEVQRCKAYLAVGEQGACYAGVPVPDAHALADFRASGLDALGTLPTPALTRHFATFCDALDAASVGATSLAELVTFARRRYEGAATDYLELPVTAESALPAFRVFAADVSARAGEFAAAYNGELAEYRSLNGVRSAAQPFPDLSADGGTFELPFWFLDRGRRRSVAARVVEGRTAVVSESADIVSGRDAAELAAALGQAGVVLAPKALALTLFNRMFVGDLFIHGVGGGRYDDVTDGVVRRFHGVEAPPFAVASLTMYLPLGGHLVTDEELERAEQRVNKLEHNPDRMLAEADFDSGEERARAVGLAAEKERLVGGIAAADADKKALGARIREVNAELGELLAPLAVAAREERDRLVAQKAAAGILTDRTYPFCLWSPAEVADKAG
ncbi:MAG: hypothetical protein C0418_01835 [Coriobacteriaceae bacterium]|nr:hypothetical protein [Coriobacteriaceae bacterium]